MRSLCPLLCFASCAPYVPPVPANPLGDDRAVRINAIPASQSEKGPVQMVLRKQVDRRWITLGQLCEAAPAAATPCPEHTATHVTYVTPGTYKVRAEYIGATGRTYWAGVTGEFEAGYVYTCEVTDEDTGGCGRVPIAEATPVLSSPQPPAAEISPPAPASPPSVSPPAPVPAPAAAAAACKKDIDCAGDLICTGGWCASPAAVPPPPTVEIAPIAPTAPAPAVTVAPPRAAACDNCPAKCAAHSSACNAGTITSCYALGACLCECKLDAGGCGDSLTALTECIATNRAKAKLAD